MSSHDIWGAIWSGPCEFSSFVLIEIHSGDQTFTFYVEKDVISNMVDGVPVFTISIGCHFAENVTPIQVDVPRFEITITKSCISWHVELEFRIFVGGKNIGGCVIALWLVFEWFTWSVLIIGSSQFAFPNRQIDGAGVWTNRIINLRNAIPLHNVFKLGPAPDAPISNLLLQYGKIPVIHGNMGCA